MFKLVRGMIVLAASFCGGIVGMYIAYLMATHGWLG